MGSIIDTLVFHPVVAVLQAGDGILSPVEHPQAKRMQRCTAALALVGVAAICAGFAVSLASTGLASTGLTAAASGYVLLVLAGLVGECMECRVWATPIRDPD